MIHQLKNKFRKIATTPPLTLLLDVFYYLSVGVIGAASLVAVYFLFWIFVWDKYPVPTTSMYPTIIPEDRVVVNKLLFGARVYKSFDFKSLQPDCFRMPGLRSIRRNEVVVFNPPYGYRWGQVAFKLNTAFCKRCIAIPGDSLSVVNGFYINHTAGDTVGYLPAQKRLSKIPDTFIDTTTLRTIPFDTLRFRWNIKNMGPLYVPKKDDLIRMDQVNYALYKNLIEYEMGDTALFAAQLNAGGAQEYRFKQNYYFMAGDNVLSSQDSRYFGLVPEEFIVGIVPFVFYHQNRRTGEVKIERTLKKMDKTH